VVHFDQSGLNIELAFIISEIMDNFDRIAVDGVEFSMSVQRWFIWRYIRMVAVHTAVATIMRRAWNIRTVTVHTVVATTMMMVWNIRIAKVPGDQLGR
jgi:hypothetical protein